MQEAIAGPIRRVTDPGRCLAEPGMLWCTTGHLPCAVCVLGGTGDSKMQLPSSVGLKAATGVKGQGHSLWRIQLGQPGQNTYFVDGSGLLPGEETAWRVRAERPSPGGGPYVHEFMASRVHVSHHAGQATPKFGLRTLLG